MSASILIAEDEPFIVESLTFLLEREGYSVRAVNDGGRAVRAILAQPADLLILDAMMPTLNGFDVLKRIRSTPGRENLPILVLTAKGQDSDRDRMIEHGADAFVTKPFSNRSLLDEIARLLAAARNSADADSET